VKFAAPDDDFIRQQRLLQKTAIAPGFRHHGACSCRIFADSGDAVKTGAKDRSGVIS
jgi:hypothetical protein